jgi:hypothetical protein
MMSYFLGKSFGPRMAISSISFIVFAVSLIACEDEMSLRNAEDGPRNISRDKTHLNDAEFGKINNLIEAFSPIIGSPDTVVMIVGKRFSPKIEENSVIFYNGVEAVILEASPIMLKVIVPQGAKTGPITVKSRGISTVSDRVFTIVKSEGDIYLESICDLLYTVWRDANGDVLRIDSNCFSSDQSFPEGNALCYSPTEDLCEDYRGITGNEISPSCYSTYEECLEAGYNSGIYIPDLRRVASLKHWLDY